jgi:hypothetical protein
MQFEIEGSTRVFEGVAGELDAVQSKKRGTDEWCSEDGGKGKGI